MVKDRISSNKETRRAIRELYENAVERDSELVRLQEERSSVRRTFARLSFLIFINIKRSFSKLILFFFRKEDRGENKQGDQTKFNNKPVLVSYPSSAGHKKKIVHFIPTLVTGGSQQLVIDLLQNIGEYDHHIVTYRTTGPIGYVGIPSYLLPAQKKAGGLDLLEFVKDIKPILLHVHFWATIENIRDWKWYESIFRLGFDLKIPLVQNCNNPTFPYFDDRIRRNVYVSHYAERVFGFNAPGNTVIYPGSNFQRFKRDAAYEPHDTVGMVYRLEKDKLNELSIEPFIQVVKKRPQTRVLIVGGGTWFDLYTTRAIEEGVADNFEFTGYVGYDELPQYYSRLGLFVAPVYQESFGQVTPFAMNMGVPVVGYDVGALSEIIDDKSLLAPSQNVVALSRIILELLENKERMLAISRRNQARAQAFFSLDTMISEYRKLYVEVLSMHKESP